MLNHVLHFEEKALGRGANGLGGWESYVSVLRINLCYVSAACCTKCTPSNKWLKVKGEGSKLWSRMGAGCDGRMVASLSAIGWARLLRTRAIWKHSEILWIFLGSFFS